MRNISISYASGDWILILDADEELINYDKLKVKDDGSGFGNVQDGAWADYLIDVKEAGLYNVSIPHAIGPTSGPSVDSNTDNKQIVLKVDNQEVGRTVTKRFDTWSKDWNAWSTTRNVQVQVKLNAGVQRLTLSLPQGDMDIGALTFTKAKDVLNVPGYINALDYSYGENIIAENNENVGFFDDNDKLEYTVNVQKADNYKMKLEYAKAEKDAEFDIYVDDVLTTSSTLETTGSFSAYKKGTVAIDLSEGSHKIMFVPKNNGGFNLKSLSFGSYIQLENDSLKEGKLDGQKIIVHLKDGKFNERLNKDNWKIDLPQGIDFDLDRVSDTEATITLKGQEVVDYDSNRTLTVEINAKEVGDKDYSLSNQTIIEAVNDEESLEDIGNLDFDSNTFDLKITGGKFNQEIKASDLTLSEEIAQYVKVSKVEVSKDGTTATVTLERTNTNYDDLAGTITVKPSGYSDGDLDLVSNIKLLKTDRLPDSIDVKDEAVKLSENDAYRKKGTLVNGAKGDYLDFFLNVEEEGNYVLTYKVKDDEAVTNGLKLSGGLGLATDNLGSVSCGKYWGNTQGYAQMLNLKAGKQTLRLEVNNPSFELTNLQIKKFY